jgi:serine phosphatase RsbU (regulator of sigma subunit)
LLTLIDQLSKDENAKAINELSTKYETEKKQQEIQLLKQDKDLKNKIIEKDKYVKLFISVVAALLLILSAISIYRYKEKKKDNSLLSEKNAAIELQKKEIELQKEQIEQTNVQIVDSINYAHRIQNSVLPSMKLVKENFPNSFVYFKPKDIVSGDFYWLVQTKNHLYFAVADCTGHGVPGAMMSMLGTSFLNQIVLSNKIELPSEILKELHLRVLETLNENMQKKESKDGMDIGLLRIDLKNKELQFAGAGRSLYTMCNGQLQTYKGEKQSIGSINNDDDFSYSLNKISFTEAMQLYLFTDGVPDQFGGTKGKKLMTKNLLEALIKMSHLSIDKQEANFRELFENWKQGFEQTDDVTLVSIHLS